MNATDESDDNPELLTPGTPGMPLSAPVAAGMLQTREPTIFFREHEDSPLPRRGAPHRPPAQSPATQPSAEQPPITEPPGPPQHAAQPPLPPRPVPAQPVPDQPVPAQPIPEQPVPEQPAADQSVPPAAAGQPGRHSAPQPPARAESGMPDRVADDPPEDPNRIWMREHLDALRVRAVNATSWLETSVHYARLLNRDGVVPVTARFSRDDIEFLGRAREDVLGFAELGLRLLELHAPLDAGGISTDPASPILRCRSCMWRWPCPTFRMLTDALSHLPHPGPPGR
jgi:hypothetical protein